MTGRVFDHAFAWQMTGTQASAAARLLADATARLGPVDEVIAIARGGIRPAHAIAARIGVPVRAVPARHNAGDGLYAEATGNVACSGTGPMCLSGRILVVDDICGTGATLRVVADELARHATPGTSLATATLCRNAGAPVRPDLTVWDDLREWVIFPWEPQPEASVTVKTLPDPERAHIS
jgi:hypothetical protein